MVHRSASLLILGLLLILTANYLPGGPPSDKPVHDSRRTTVAQVPRRSPPLTPQTKKRPQTSFFRTLVDQLDGVPRDDLPQSEYDQLRNDALTADKIWDELKRTQRHAIAEMNRQVRAGRYEAPNIVLIVADRLGIGDLGPYGQDRIRTPSLDRLASGGLVYTNYYAGSPDATEGSAVLETGRHASHLKTPAAPLGAGQCTIAETLWQAGYFTAQIGHWRLGDPASPGSPNRQGFVEAFGFATNGDELSTPPTLWRNQSRAPRDMQNTPDPLAMFTEEAIGVMRRAGDRPFFLQYDYPLSKKLPGTGDQGYRRERWTPAQREHAAAVTRFDQEVGRILDWLDGSPLARNTLVIVTAATGPESAADFFGGTGPYSTRPLGDGRLRAPLLTRNVAPLPQGRRLGLVWGAVDMLPTLADLASAWRRPSVLDGTSVFGLLGSPAAMRPEGAVLYWRTSGKSPVEAVRKGVWKGIRSGRNPWQLFDIGADPAETRNLASQNPRVVESLKAAFVQAGAGR